MSAVLFILVLFNGNSFCSAGETKPADNFTGFYVGQLSGAHYSWDNFDPLQYLDLLRKNPSRVICR